MLARLVIKPSANSQCGSGPITGLNSQAQLRPVRKVGTAQGRKTSACAMAAAGERPVEQQRQDQAEHELQEHRGAGPPQRVAQRAVEIVVAVERAEMIEPDEAAGERVEQLDVAEGIGKAERQRHQHDRDDQDQRRRRVEIGLGRVAPSGRAAAGAAARRRPAVIGVAISDRLRSSDRRLPAAGAARRDGRRLRPLTVGLLLLGQELLLRLGQVVGPLIGHLLGRDVAEQRLLAGLDDQANP